MWSREVVACALGRASLQRLSLLASQNCNTCFPYHISHTSTKIRVSIARARKRACPRTMIVRFTRIFLGTSFVFRCFAHMSLPFPAPFNSSHNPNRLIAADSYFEDPYDCCDEEDRGQYPCRGYHKLLHTAQGAPTATWQPGTAQNWPTSGSGNHYG